VIYIYIYRESLTHDLPTLRRRENPTQENKTTEKEKEKSEVGVPPVATVADVRREKKREGRDEGTSFFFFTCIGGGGGGLCDCV
jgi:hypothetical protein